jgi:hypothetical protein
MVSVVFSITTLAVMAIMVTFGYYGLKIFEFRFVHKYMHVLSGFAIGTSGLLMVVFGL